MSSDEPGDRDTRGSDAGDGPDDGAAPDASREPDVDTGAAEETTENRESDETDEADVAEETAEGDEAVTDETAEGDAGELPAAPEVDGGDARAAERSTVWRKRVLLGSSALAIAGLLVASLFGVMWWVASTDDKAELGSEREAVLDAGREAVQAFTELDYTNPDAYFARNKAVSTEEMRTQIEETEQSYRKAIAEAKTKVDTIVNDIAVQELNNHEGKASFLAVIETDITKGDKRSSKTLRLQAQMSRVAEDGKQVWKLAGISEVPIVGPGK